MEEHTMRLRDEPFACIAAGRKTIELRLYDEKRRGIAVGDRVCFVHWDDPRRVLRAQVTALHLFPTFADLYAALPPAACGYGPDDCASPADMDRYYTKEEQSRYGVVGIEIALIGENR